MMFTQLFGSYLLNKKLITADQLKTALEYQKTVHIKLGVLAVNSGFMNAECVNKIYNLQYSTDKKFGELATESGFLSEKELKILLNTQKSDYLLLGQAIIEKEYMSLEQFEEAVNNYKRDYNLTNEKFNLLQNENIDEIVNTFYSFKDSSESYIYKEYLSLFIRNVIRFIDDDFRPLDIIPINNFKLECGVSQEIRGEINLKTYITAEEETFIKFAGKFTKETLLTNDEYVKASVGEFLNLVNGIYLVNMSNNNVELELTPQKSLDRGSLTNFSEAFCIPIVFSFGKIDFIISK
jgi:CheY-specific phosphatase CheX